MTSTTINEWSHLGQTMLFTACKTISLLLNEWLNPTLTCEIILLTKRKNVDRKWTPYEVAYINQAKARECLRSQGELCTVSHLENGRFQSVFSGVSCSCAYLVSTRLHIVFMFWSVTFVQSWNMILFLKGKALGAVMHYRRCLQI